MINLHGGRDKILQTIYNTYLTLVISDFFLIFRHLLFKWNVLYIFCEVKFILLNLPYSHRIILVVLRSHNIQYMLTNIPNRIKIRRLIIFGCKTHMESSWFNHAFSIARIFLSDQYYCVSIPFYWSQGSTLNEPYLLVGQDKMCNKYPLIYNT